MGTDYLTISQMAELLGAKYSRVVSRIYEGKLPEPARKVGHIRLYSPEQAEEVGASGVLGPKRMGRPVK